MVGAGVAADHHLLPGGAEGAAEGAAVDPHHVQEVGVLAEPAVETLPGHL